MRRHITAVLLAAFACVLAACQPTETPRPNAPASTPAPAVSPTTADTKATTAPTTISALEGNWPGPDGTSLVVTKAGDKFKVEITGRDKKAESFEGMAKADTIEFKRNDKIETIKAATPEETGLRWTQGEKSCVVITKGSEGYCRK